MATVWEAIDTAKGVTVAVKILGRLDEISRGRFFREGQLMAEVDHPNVVEVHGVFSLPHNGALMAMERLHGESLADRLWSRARLSAAEATRVGIALLDALAAIHAQGIVHRDLKPENVFLTEDGGIKLLDFGIATATSGSLKLTRTGALVGTPVYMAPEQILEEEGMGAPVDLWALGIVLYECITGRSPTDRDNLGQVFQAILVGGYPLPHLLQPSCPRPLSELIMALLCRAPEVRPTAPEARHKLAAMRDGMSVDIARPETFAEAVTPAPSLTVEAASAPPTAHTPISIRGGIDGPAEWAASRTTELPPPLGGMPSPVGAPDDEELPPRRPVRLGRYLAAAYAAVAMMGICDVPTPGPEPLRALTKQALAAIQIPDAAAQVAAPVAPKEEHVTIAISASPETTKIFIDGKAVGGHSFRTEVPRAKEAHRVVLSAPGHEPIAFELSYEASRSFDLSLAPKPAGHRGRDWVARRVRPIERRNPYRYPATP